ncbi:MAG: hypothetical protein LH615_01695 [Ferruginibacter sp.]|nr:hypothetical protein [Ferruginibacter sp.]
MKTTIIYLLIIALCVSMLVNSCAAGKNNIVIAEANIENVNEKAGCYVVLKDGTVKNYSTLKLVTGIFKTPHLLADGSVKILPGSIKEYKDANYYAIAQNEFYNKVKTHVATNVLPGFAVREIKGDLNVYSIQFYNGSNVYKKYFLQKGKDGKIAPYTAQLLNEYAKDNEEVKNFLSKKKSNQKQLLAVVNNYNNSQSISRN